MALLEWRKEFETGIAGVDHEHEALIAQINSVYELIDTGEQRQPIIDGLDEIYGNIAHHFALEEQLMRRYRYDQYPQHQADHERLLDEIRDITGAFESSQTLDHARLARALADWFQLHFKTHDARLHRMTDADRSQQPRGPALKSLLKRITGGSRD